MRTGKYFFYKKHCSSADARDLNTAAAIRQCTVFSLMKQMKHFSDELSPAKDTTYNLSSLID